MKKMLDVGTGPGTINNIGYYKLHCRGYEIHGIDMLPVNVNMIKREVNGKFKQGIAEKIPYESKYFDLVVARHILEHVRDVDKAMNEIARVTNNGGEVRISVPDYRLEYLMEKLIPKYLLSGIHHERLLKEKDLINLLKKNNLNIKNIKYDKWPMFMIVVVLAVVSRMFHKIKMENQSGVFKAHKISYIDTLGVNNKVLVYLVLEILNKLLFVLNFIIPFELTIIAKNDST